MISSYKVVIGLKLVINVGGVTYSAAEIQKNVKTFNEIPGPSSLPFIGPTHNFLPGGKLAGYEGVKLSERLYNLYGPIVRLDGILGGNDTVFLFDPDAVEHVLRSEEPTPVRPALPSLTYYRQRHNKNYDPEQITGLGTDQGDNWKQLRSAVNPILMQPKNVKLYTDVLVAIADEMVARFRLIRDDKNQLSKKLDMEITLWALESVGVVALGTRLNCFDPSLPADSPAKELIHNVREIFNIAYELDFKPNVWKLISTPSFKTGMKIYEENERLTKYFIDQTVKNLEKSKKSGTTSKSEKAVLVKLLGIDIRIAHVIAADMLLGGIDMTVIAVICMLYLLAINPAKQSKLREEVLGQENRKQFLRACLKESMRMMSPVAVGNTRLSTKEYNLLGYRVPKNVLVVCAQHYMPLMEKHFPRPDEFIPERWLADKNDPLYYGNTHAFVMAPWGYGVRSCVGRRIAELEIEMLITKMIENFQIDWTSSETLQFSPSIFNYVKGPFHFAFKDLPRNIPAINTK